MGDYYKVLGLTFGANQDEIKLAFRKLALLHHPDRHISSTKAQQEQAAARFKAITEAYDVLTDDRKRTQYEASVRSGGTTGSSYGTSGRYTYGHHSHNVNTDWAYSRYSHRDHARARISWFQQLQRAVGARKLEAGLTLAGVGLLLFGGSAVDAAWTARNQGKSFRDMQSARMATSASSAAAAPDGSSSGGALGSSPGTAGAVGGSQRPKPFSPAVGCSSSHSASSVLKLRRPGALLPGSLAERHLAGLPLAELLAAEAEACIQDHNHNHHNHHTEQQQQHQQMEKESVRSDAPGGGGVAIQYDEDLVRQRPTHPRQQQHERGIRPISVDASGDLALQGARGAAEYVGKVVVLPAPSPPGLMAGHRPPESPPRG
ncbi:hypothetical protein VaNZ11_006103 [Volvox africanus]|uniref:J domain-containing protein n=1 Tax=Volvox africanus TaxID=51714 RepID=A0ABQ5S0R6_9CHLO|nr:hypothetical protein VaNZ11_006103 [Volvox africanus]